MSKLNVVVVSSILLLATAVMATPMKIANAQQQSSTPTNQTGINVGQQIAEWKSKYPVLSSSHGSDVKDIIQKIQGLDKQQALRTLAAYHILRNLQELQALTGSTNSSG